MISDLLEFNEKKRVTIGLIKCSGNGYYFVSRRPAMTFNSCVRTSVTCIDYSFAANIIKNVMAMHQGGDCGRIVYMQLILLLLLGQNQLLKAASIYESTNFDAFSFKFKSQTYSRYIKHSNFSWFIACMRSTYILEYVFRARKKIYRRSVTQCVTTLTI